MFEKKMDKLREKLYSLIIQKAEYSEVLKASEQLDDCIAQYIYEKLNRKSK